MMKNYLIGTLTVIIIFLGSVVFKQQNNPVFTHFPVTGEMKKQSSEASLFLFLFFSKKNCASCLDQVVDVLNGLSPPFYVSGVVPREELEDEMELRRITKAAFPLSSFEKYGKFVPMYTPTLIGVSPEGKILFVLPGNAMQGRNIENFLTSTYSKLYHLLGSS